jgi:hypothetical protein
MEQLENELKTLKAQGIAQASSKQQSSQSNTRGKLMIFYHSFSHSLLLLANVSSIIECLLYLLRLIP